MLSVMIGGCVELDSVYGFVELKNTNFSYPSSTYVKILNKDWVATTKVFQMIDHKPGVDINGESSVELDLVSGQELKNANFHTFTTKNRRIITMLTPTSSYIFGLF